MGLTAAKHSIYYQNGLAGKQFAGKFLWVFVLVLFPLFGYTQIPEATTDSLIPLPEQHQILIENDSISLRNQIPDSIQIQDNIQISESNLIRESDQFALEEEPEKKHSPQRAAMLSATLPGLGQIYNRKYWKVPAVYAGFGAVIYFLEFNNSRYQEFRRAWVARVDGNPNTTDDFPAYSTDQLERATKYYQRNLEITYISAAAIYLLNILDATVDAHLLDFDVGEDLSMNVRPTVIQFSNQNNLMKNQAPVAGLKFSFKF